MPGFIDCHNHAGGDILLYEVLVGNPYEVEFVTIASIVEKLRAKAQKTPPGIWVEGYFFDDTKVKDKRPLNVHDLDQVSKEHPVCVHHRGGHTSFYNSKALAAGRSRPRTLPTRRAEPMTAMRTANSTAGNRPRTGRVRQGRQAGDFHSGTEQQRDRDGLAYISKQFVRYGLTSVHHEGGDLFALQQVRARGELLHRVSYEASGECWRR